MSHRDPPARGPRAQGERTNPWPAGIVDERDNCCVALRVRLGAAREDGDYDVLHDEHRVGWGPALTTLRELIRTCFKDEARAVLEFEVEAIGWIDPRCPLRLERITETTGGTVFLDALILPFGERDAAELAELFREEPDPGPRHERGWDYALALARRWERAAPDATIACRFLDADFPVTRAQDAPVAPGGPLPAPRRQPLPARF